MSGKRTDVLQLRVTSDMLARWQGAASASKLALHAWAEEALERASERPLARLLSAEDHARLLADLNDPSDD